VRFAVNLAPEGGPRRGGGRVGVVLAESGPD